MLDQRFALAIEAIRVARLRVYDFSIDVHGIIILEGRVSSEHFVQEDAQSPPIYGFSMSLVQQNLRCNILGGATNCISSFRDHFSETEVNQLQVPITANHDVFWLQITVDNLFALQIFKNGNHLCTVESSLLWIKVANAPMVREDVSTLE